MNLPIIEQEKEVKEFQRTYKEYSEGGDIAPSDITCNNCPYESNATCEWAWDMYNTHGDCLALK